MAKYRKKPVVIEAVQWHPFDEWCYYRDGEYMNRRIGYDQFGVAHTVTECGIQTLEGFMRVKPGDWIITGIKGEKYPCRDDIFQSTYAPADAAREGADGVSLIAAERERQIEEENWSPKHDDVHNTGGELSWAAAAYATVGSAVIRGASAEEFPADMVLSEGIWPGDWSEVFWKPSDDPIRNLVKAGALIAAELDRLKRQKENTNGE